MSRRPENRETTGKQMEKEKTPIIYVVAFLDGLEIKRITVR